MGEVRNQKMMLEIAQENKRLSAPMEKAHKEEHYLNRELEHYAKDKIELKEEKDDLYKRLQSAVYEVQQKAGFKSSLVNKKLELLDKKMETNTVLLGEALSAAGIAPDKVPGASMRMRQVVEEKDQVIQELQGDILALSTGYNDMIATYMAKLEEYSFPQEDLGFKPVEVKEPIFQ